ncbi:PREDICTED: M-phase phosphoprotein 6 [Ceratosolen solmsi marchali]|uniref:M-phase phosphoprotein 6 n=1 Tax=Ceratosolen solmsi marchali TaxID=326594 RepID=A0AAJ6YXC1_9HYME|nr:PREDICTED: M-phase phosphoprotein 6 [Ceratosolen solmsi marchali]
MASKDSNKISLSKSILEMKFMKKTKDKVDKQAYQKEGEEYFNKQGLAKHAGRYIIEPSYILCEQLIDGRLSFHGENNEIERIMEHEAQEKKENNNKIKYNETDISDKQMSKIWKSTTKINVHNISRNRENSNEPRRKKPKFLKPVD